MRFVLASLLLMLVAIPAAAKKPISELLLSTQGEIVIASDGRVASIQLDPVLPREIRDALGRGMSDWQFEPVVVDGAVRTARTGVQLTVRAKRNPDGNYSLYVESAWFGISQPRPENSAPVFPREALARGVGGQVLVIARLDANGQVVEAHPYQTNLDWPLSSERKARKLRAALEREALAAASRWNFGAHTGAQAVGRGVMLPVAFILQRPSGNTTTTTSRVYYPGPISEAPWVRGNELAQFVTYSGDGDDPSEVAARIRLTSDVIGKVL
jgi:hypothetical protein